MPLIVHVADIRSVADSRGRTRHAAYRLVLSEGDAHWEVERAWTELLLTVDVVVSMKPNVANGAVLDRDTWWRLGSGIEPSLVHERAAAAETVLQHLVSTLAVSVVRSVGPAPLLALLSEDRPAAAPPVSAPATPAAPHAAPSGSPSAETPAWLREAARVAPLDGAAGRTPLRSALLLTPPFVANAGGASRPAAAVGTCRLDDAGAASPSEPEWLSAAGEALAGDPAPAASAGGKPPSERSPTASLASTFSPASSTLSATPSTTTPPSAAPLLAGWA